MPDTAALDLERSTAAPERNVAERILLVEDDEALRASTARILRRSGYEVVTADDGLDALDQVDRSTTEFDLVLTDALMPRMGGEELVEVLAASRPGVKAIVMSGNGPRSPSDPVLGKPILQEALLRAVRRSLDS